MEEPKIERPGAERPIEKKLLQILQAFVADLGMRRAVQAVSLDASLERDLGLGSLERVELLLRIEKAFQVRLSENVAAEARTPQDLVDAILHALPAGPARPTLRSERLPPLRGAIERPGAERLIEAPTAAATLAEALLAHVEAAPDRPHLYLPQEEGEEETITYRMLFDAAAETAGGLVARGIGRGESVGIMLPTGSDFFYAFFGVLLAGGVPVPLYPPFRADQIEEYAHRQAAILHTAEARLLILSEEVGGLARLLRPFIPSLKEAATVEALRIASTEPPLPPTRGDDAALIQFTSGSTAEPKGVLLTHRNILANIRAIGRAARIGPTDVGVSWLPLYHDMGLIGSWLCSLYFGVPIAILSPLAFLSRPERWLWTLHYHQATLSAAPNFAYELCVRRIDDQAIEGLDLSSWRIAFNGAEAVNPDTLIRFTRRFAPYGFRPEALLPVYGLAESSVALSFPPLGRPPRIDRVAREPFERERRAAPAADREPAPLRFVSCGVPLPGHEIRIVDDAGKEAPDRVEGSLQFRGPSAMKGYFRNPEKTAAVFCDGWWDSEDLAYRAEGEIFITGRRKDIIIKTGHNLYPQEVEEAAGEVPGIRKGCVAAFGTADPETGTEKLVVVAETREEGEVVRERLASEVMERVAAAIGVRPDLVLITPPGTVPKTSSGKLRRSACKEAYLRGEIGRRRRAVWLQIAKLWTAGVGARARRGLRALFGLIYAGYIGALLLITLPPTWLAIALAPQRGVAAKISKLWSRGFLWLAGCPLTVKGIPNLVGAGPLVLVANHGSYLDAVVLMAALPPDFLFTVKRELTRAPIIRTFIRKVGHLTVDRLDFSRSASDAKEIEEALRRGGSVLIFPEGTFSRVRGLRPFRLGAFKVAVETGRPICTISLRGTREILWPGRAIPRRGPVRVAIGKPIVPQGRDWREIIRLREAAKAEIVRDSGELPLDRVAAEIPLE